MSDGGGVEHLGEFRAERLGIAPTGRWMFRRAFVLRNRATNEIIARGRLFSLRRQRTLYRAVRKAIKHGHTQVAAHVLAPILAAAQDIQPTPPTSDAYVRIQEAIADLARDELNYRQTPTRERAIALRRGLERLVTTALALVEGLNRRHEL
jgi:hypothetical protein